MKYRGKCKHGCMRQTGGRIENPLGNTPVVGTPEQREMANATAQRLAKKYNLMDPDNMTIGQYLPGYVDPSGRPVTASPIPTRQLPTTLPQGIGISDIQSDQGVYWYNDPSTGDPVDVDPSVVHRFKVPTMSAPTATSPVFTGRRRGGYASYQPGGTYIDPNMFQSDPREDEAYFDRWNPQEPAAPRYRDVIEEGIQKGIIQPPRGYEDSTAGGMEWYNTMTALPPRKRKRNWMTPLGIGMMGARGVLSEISGRVERNRQDNYDAIQQRLLGSEDPANIGDFQPNPYNLYAKYGGNIKNYTRPFNNDVEMRFDRDADKALMQRGGRNLRKK